MGCEGERLSCRTRTGFRPYITPSLLGTERSTGGGWTLFCPKISDDGIFITSLWERLKEAGKNEENEESKVGTVQKNM
jgi:hypothetical protein